MSRIEDLIKIASPELNLATKETLYDDKIVDSLPVSFAKHVITNSKIYFFEEALNECNYIQAVENKF